MASVVNIEPNDDTQALIRKCNENFKNLAKRANTDGTEIINNADDLSDVKESVGKQLLAISQSVQALRDELTAKLDALPKIYSGDVSYSDAYGNIVNKVISLPNDAPLSTPSIFVLPFDPDVKVELRNRNNMKIEIRIDGTSAKSTPVFISWLAVY